MTIVLPLPIPKDPNFVYPVSDLELAKSLLSSTITHPALIIPSKLTNTIRNALKDVLMNRPKLKDIYQLSPEDHHPDPSIKPKSERKIVLTNDNDEHPKERIYAHPAVKQLLDHAVTIRRATHAVIFGYEQFTVEQTLAKILPKEELSEIPSSFEVIGHLAHITLREEYYPFKHIIGRTILDKNKGIQVVVNKTGTIQNEFRTFPMEILADDRKDGNGNEKGTTNNDDELNLLVEVKEDGCRFQLDFEKVYWNSRLQFEHRRIVHLITGKGRPTNLEKRDIKIQSQTENSKSKNRNKNRNDEQDPQQISDNTIVVVDACAGIGPFAIPLTSQYANVTVYANDLNPESYKYLKMNAKLNKCNDKGKGKLCTYNMDGRHFLRKMDDEGIRYDHVLMNLPAIAPEFLNVFRGWRGDYDHRPVIHVHCFAAKVEGDQEAIARCGKSLGCQLDLVIDQVSVHEVRNVSPKKNMYCVSFKLPEGVKNVEQVHEFDDVTSTEEDDGEGEDEPATKKSRTN